LSIYDEIDDAGKRELLDFAVECALRSGRSRLLASLAAEMAPHGTIVRPEVNARPGHQSANKHVASEIGMTSREADAVQEATYPIGTGRMDAAPVSGDPVLGKGRSA
jgi:hypothetical protein